MSRLLVHVEGQTEEDFVNEALRPYLLARGYHSVSARIVGNARQRTRRGGIKPWSSVKRDIMRHLKEDPACVATTMVDFYGLPSEWPGRTKAQGLPAAQKAACVEAAMLGDFQDELGDAGSFLRFLPFVVMHEFEGLLFSDCARFSAGICRPGLTKDFQRIRDQFETPEDINDSPRTAPSKRVEELVPGYEKPLLGTLAVLEIGLDAIRRECPHFNDWLGRLARAGGRDS